MEDNFSLSCELQSFIRDHQKRISSARNLDDIQESLGSLLDVLSEGVLPTLDFSSSEKNFIKADFAKQHFVRCADLLLCEPAVEFLSSLDALHEKKLETFFVEGPSCESFLVLMGALSQTLKSQNVKVIISLLEKFIISKRLVDLFVKNCHKGGQGLLENSKNGHHKFNSSQTVTFLVSLPERVANKLRLKSKSVFYPEAFFTEVARQFQEALELIHASLASNSKEAVTLSFLSDLIGRICIAGHGKTILVVLLPQFERWTSTSPLWSRICQKLVTGISDHELEPVVENLLREASSPRVIVKLLGDDILTNSRLKFLLTTKFILLRYYTDVQILGNIIGYLSGCKRRHLLIETLGKLFDSWSNSSAILHTPYDQHVYISCAIVHIIGYLGNDEREKHKHEVLKKLLTGVQNHLESPEHKARRLGMIVAECVTSVLEPNAEKLSFEYDDDDDSLLIKDLSKGLKSELIKKSDSKPGKKTSKKQENLHSVKSGEGTSVSQKGVKKPDDDDDDDLEPYDLDEEEFEGPKPPRHLRECIEALTEAKDMERFEAALKTLEKLVCSHPSDLDEVCLELIKILLYLQDQFTTEDYLTLRQKAMVAITTRCPVAVATYLTEEFYGANYCIIQRLDILDVLAVSAQQLSQPIEMTQEKATSKRFLPPGEHSHTNVEWIPEWQKVIQERIEKKTRRFAKGPSKAQPKPVANKFAQVAGHFFYSLMKNFDHKQSTLDLLGDDSFVLGRLIYTLGVVVHSAKGAPTAHNMGVALIEFSWALRYHSEPTVRQVLVFALVMVFSSVPIALLLSECSDGVFEIHNWLKDLMEKDDSIDVKRMAVQALLVLEDAFKKEVVQDVQG
ncbi:hypothetical protein QZH41_002774 [Actinostola sp. cb2023]|nr:hypothetical protein QZH41_002774 [Actinostola sp. cb2023]